MGGRRGGEAACGVRCAGAGVVRLGGVCDAGSTSVDECSRGQTFACGCNTLACGETGADMHTQSSCGAMTCQGVVGHEGMRLVGLVVDRDVPEEKQGREERCAVGGGDRPLAFLPATHHLHHPGAVHLGNEREVLGAVGVWRRRKPVLEVPPTLNIFSRVRIHQGRALTRQRQEQRCPPSQRPLSYPQRKYQCHPSALCTTPSRSLQSQLGDEAQTQTQEIPLVLRTETLVSGGTAGRRGDGPSGRPGTGRGRRPRRPPCCEALLPTAFGR